MEHSERQARSAMIPVPAIDPTVSNSLRVGLFDVSPTGNSLDARAARLRLLLHENQELRAANCDLTAKVKRLSSKPGLPWSFATGWFPVKWSAAKAKSSAGTGMIKPASWQEVHCQDTARWTARAATEHQTRERQQAVCPASDAPSRVPALGWVHQNAALVYLLRTGQWQPVPSSPPDTWAERLAARFSGITMDAARKILSTAFDAIPELTKATLPEQLSGDEREWVRQNSATVKAFSAGRLRGIPTSPSRAWVAALQSAVGGTMVEISAILAVVLDIACHVHPTMVTAE